MKNKHILAQYASEIVGKQVWVIPYINATKQTIRLPYQSGIIAILETRNGHGTGSQIPKHSVLGYFAAETVLETGG